MEDGFQGIFNRLPFPVLELHPDNGGEFFNRYLLQSWKEQVKGLRLTRSRPYQKNDNRFVEENNFSLVRAYVGYGRLDTIAHTRLLHQLYEQLWLYHNFFQPVMRLRTKINLPGQLRGKRVYDRAQPPFDRLCAKGVLSEKQRQLHDLREATNPYQLRCSIEKLITQLFQLPRAKEGVTEDVYQPWVYGNPNISRKPSRLLEAQSSEFCAFWATSRAEMKGQRLSNLCPAV
jgi:hypothetical protein